METATLENVPLLGGAELVLWWLENGISLPEGVRLARHRFELALSDESNGSADLRYAVRRLLNNPEDPAVVGLLRRAVRAAQRYEARELS